MHFVVEYTAFVRERRRLWAAYAQCPGMGNVHRQGEARGMAVKAVFVSSISDARTYSVMCALKLHGRFLEEACMHAFAKREKLQVPGLT